MFFDVKKLTIFRSRSRFFCLTFTLSYTLNILKFCWMKGENKWLFDRQNWSSVLNVASETVIFGAKSMATKMSVKILSAPNTPNPFGFRSIWCWTLHMLHSFWKITKLIFGLLWNKSDHLILNLMIRSSTPTCILMQKELQCIILCFSISSH